MNTWHLLSMRRPFRWEVTPRSALLSVAAIVLSWSPLALAAISNLGELLDSGATRLSAEDFTNELVGRVIFGPAQTAVGMLELDYLPNGMLIGTGTSARMSAFASAEISGTWKIDADGKICTSMRMGGAAGAVNGVVLPTRCQVWFKYADRYYVSDSDTDRSAKVLERAIKN